MNSKIFKSIISGVLVLFTVLTNIGPFVQPSVVKATAQPSGTSASAKGMTTDFNSLPELLITEIMPNNAGTDDYEYFEVYNNSDKPLVLDHYSFAIRYTDGSNADRSLQFKQATIGPKETRVLWLNLSNKTVADFNAHYKTNLTDEQVVQSTDAIGLYNSGNRGIVITDAGKEIAVANYVLDDIASGLVAQYKYPDSGIEMTKFQQKATPTPGIVDTAQIPAETVKLPANAGPVVNHTPIKSATTDKDLKISATITDETNVKATLSYKAKSDSPAASLPMNKVDGKYEAVIPASELVEGTLQYSIQITDKNNRVMLPSVDSYSVKVSAPLVEDFNSYPQLLVTELSPNSKGTGTDNYEYFELYNNTNQPLQVNNYIFVYRYTDTGVEKTFQVPATTIKPQENLVFWFNNNNLTLSDFNNQFGTSLTNDQVVQFKDTFPGFANGGNRAIVLKDKDGKEVVSASYLDKETDNNGKVVEYTYPKSGTAMDKLHILANPNPGSILADQVPSTPVMLPDATPDHVKPVIEHAAITQAYVQYPIQVEAKVTDDKSVAGVTLYYKKENDSSFSSLQMNASVQEAGKYTAEIPSPDAETTIIYYIEASDGTNTVKTSEYNIAVSKPDVDFNKVPQFLVTEVVPDSTNTGGSDGYEFVEVYNNSDKDINFKDYKLQYRYGTDVSSDVIWPSVPDDVVIKAQGTLVFWIINGSNDDKTVADFNQNYGTNLVENKDIVRVYSGGMANGSPRGLVVADNTKKEVTVSYYNDKEGVDDTQPDKGILYKYPVDGSRVSSKVSAGVEKATPGHVEGYQVPSRPVHIEEDHVKPTIENLSSQTQVKETENIKLSADVKDDKGVKTVKVFYKTNTDSEYKSMIVQQNFNTILYDYIIYSPEFIAKNYVEYYFVASDGTNDVKSNTYKVNITTDRNTDSLRLNVKGNEVLRGNKIIKGTSADDQNDAVHLLIDNKEIAADTYHALENKAFFAYDVSNVNTFFKNGVTMGDEVLHIFDDWMLEWQTITVPIDPNRLKVGDNVLTIRSGNKVSPFDLESKENRDDYSLRNVRLVLGDGTILTDPTYNNPEKVIAMNDAHPFVDFHFGITDTDAKSKAYNWDTTKVADGSHMITVKDSNEEKQIPVLVDNTAPVIVPSIEKGKQYKGQFVIDPTISDAIAGVDVTEITLDGKRVFAPYTTSSSQLAAGAHLLHIKATDKAGNVNELDVPFSVVDENPAKPQSSIPTGTLDGASTLRVNVSDPTNDDLNVSFYKAFQYKPSDTNSVKSYQNKADIEPPQSKAPAGEQPLIENDLSLVSAKDGKYLTTDSTTKFPYHRFDVTLDPSVDENDTVELEWKGKSLDGRKVTMYAWSYLENKWKPVTYKIAGSEDFTLKGNVNFAEYAKDHKVNVLVQDEIPASPVKSPATPDDYDYTFVWMSDTQYYSASYPYIYDAETKWIVDNQDKYKIKYVFHTGDIVDDSTQQYQWDAANKSMKVLDDANVPYGVLAGNHDVGHKLEDYTEYYKNYGADRFQNKPYYGESYENNRGHYDLISADGNDYIMVYMGWGVDDAGIAWMNKVLAEHPDRKAILNFHEYLLASGTRSPIGDKIYNEVILKNPNVIAALSGHYHASETLVDDIDDNGDGSPDRKVYQILADYQAGPQGGEGYMRLLHINKATNKISVETYSPYMNDYNYYNTDQYPGKDEFTMDVDLQPKDKRVATDYFSVNVYTDSKIGSVDNVKSGTYAEVKWNGLTENNMYSWYAVATDHFTGKSISDIYTFTKGKDEVVTDPGTNTGGTPGTGENPGTETGGTSGASTNGTSGVSSDQNDNLIVSEEGTYNTNADKQGNTLPDTATTVYTEGIVGLLLVLVGGTLYMLRRKKTA